MGKCQLDRNPKVRTDACFVWCDRASWFMDSEMAGRQDLGLASQLSGELGSTYSTSPDVVRRNEVTLAVGTASRDSGRRIADHRGNRASALPDQIVTPRVCRYNPRAMALRDLVIRSQLIPPQQRKGVLHRPRLASRLALAPDVPLTFVQAGTGCGKSTALATLAEDVERLFWYTITEPDSDPLLFLANLICAEHTIEQVRVHQIMRVQVEPPRGLCRALGYNGDLVWAQQYDHQALDIALMAIDE